MIGTTSIVALVIALGACAPVVDESPAVPPVRAERVPAPPPSEVTLIWQPGHYDWDGTTYQWSPGEWVARAGHGPLWQDGFWRRATGGFVWVPAHWM